MIRILASLYSFLYVFKGKEFRTFKRTICASALKARRLRKTAACIGAPILVRGEVRVSRQTEIGKGNVINGLRVYGEGRVQIGNHCSFGPGLIIQTQNHDYDTGNRLPYGSGFICKAVRIDDCVWIGMNVTLLPGTHVGEGAIIQAGSVVHGEIPPLAIAGGNPAKVFSSRNKDHYEDLKQKQAFNMW